MTFRSWVVDNLYNSDTESNQTLHTNPLLQKLQERLNKGNPLTTEQDESSDDIYSFVDDLEYKQIQSLAQLYERADICEQSSQMLSSTSFSLRDIGHKLSLLNPLFKVVFALFCLSGFFQANFINAVIEYKGGFYSAYTLLQAYQLLLMLMLIIALGGFIWLFKGVKFSNWQNTKLIIVCIFLYAIAAFAMVFSENLIGKYLNAMADIKAIENDNLYTREVFIAPRSYAQNFDMPTNFEVDVWRQIYVYSIKNISGSLTMLYPLAKDYPFDTEHVFKRNRSLSENLKHARTYKITYTPNLNVVFAIEPQPLGQSASKSEAVKEDNEKREFYLRILKKAAEELEQQKRKAQ